MKKFLLLAATASTLLIGTQAHAQVGYADTTTCREFTSTITVGNRLQQGVGTACLQGDGSWAIVSGPGTGTSFIDNGIPVAYPANSYPVNNVYYSQPAQVQYVVQRERVYVPRSNTIIISNGYGRRPWGYPHYIRGHDHHDHGWGHGPGRGHGHRH